MAKEVAIKLGVRICVGYAIPGNPDTREDYNSVLVASVQVINQGLLFVQGESKMSVIGVICRILSRISSVPDYGAIGLKVVQSGRTINVMVPQNISEVIL
jgi:hypothetical protein